MSTEVSVEDEPGLVAALADVRSDTSTTRFLLCGHVVGNPNKITLVATGDDPAELADKVVPNEAMYGLARYSITHDMSQTVKFVYIRWLGPSLPAVRRGRIGVVKGAVAARLLPAHLTLETSTTDDLDTDAILQSLQSTAGTVSKVLDNDVASQRQARGFTATQLPQRQAKQGFTVSAVASQGASVEFLPEVASAVASVRSDGDATQWMVAGYKGGSAKGPVELVASGEGGLSELTAALDEAAVMYGLTRLSHTDADDITTVKFVYVTWVGKKVKPMTKAATSTHKGEATGVFGPAHVSVFASETSDISQTDIMDQIKKQGAQ